MFNRRVLNEEKRERRKKREYEWKERGMGNKRKSGNEKNMNEHRIEEREGESYKEVAMWYVIIDR